MPADTWPGDGRGWDARRVSAAPTPGPQLERGRQMEALLSSPGLGVGTGRGSHVLEANDELLRILGRDAGELRAGLSWTQVTSVEPDRGVALVEQIRADGGAVIGTEVRRPDGTTVPILANLAATSWDPFSWVVVVVDLSAEERFRHLASQDAAIVSALLEEAPVGFSFISPDLRFVRVNREVAAMNGHSVQAHEGAGVFDLLPDLRSSAEPILRGVLETGAPVRDVEIVGTTPADPGRVHTWVESFFPVRSGDGPIVGVAAIVRDETKLRALQDELARTSRSQQWALEELQTTLLPERLVEVPGYALAARYLPASGDVGLGGDWFDVIDTEAGTVVATVGDVVGHGIEALGLMAQASAASRAYTSEGHRPGQALAQLNRLLCRSHLDGLASAVIVSLDVATGAVEYARAGHPYPLLGRADGTASILTGARGRLLGIVPDGSYDAASVVLEPGSTLLLYTDGLVERRTESMGAGIDRLAGLLAAGAGADLETLLDQVVEACLEGQRRDDDVCVVAIRRR